MLAVREVMAMPHDTDTDTADEQSPADWALIRQLLIDALPDVAVLSTWSTHRAPLHATDPQRQNPPLRLVDMSVRTAAGPAMSRALLAWCMTRVPVAHRLLSLLEQHDRVLMRRYVLYLHAIRHLPQGGRGIARRDLVELAARLDRAPSTLRADVVRAERFMVSAVHAEHMRQIERLRVRLEALPTDLDEHTADELWTEA